MTGLLARSSVSPRLSSEPLARVLRVWDRLGYVRAYFVETRSSVSPRLSSEPLARVLRVWDRLGYVRNSTSLGLLAYRDRAVFSSV